ncbi:MAG: group 1 glycosyl transferase, partial [Deltaproteobacteria bacterium]|nr:group 1 glycosyl transferase [Deltaproteobacteria bacterium]
MPEPKTQKLGENRSQNGQAPGAGSQGRLADFKAEIINDFVEKHNVKSATELGCGEGNLLSLLNFNQFIG